MNFFSSRTQLIVFLIFLIFLKNPSLISAQNTNFNFPSFNSFESLSFLGDSHLRNGVIGLTKLLNVPSSSSGTIIYNHPIEFSNQESTHIASFSTRFSFSINNVNPASYGDGLAFFISPDNQTLGSPGGYLGLVNSTQLTKNKFVAVEFDTRLDLHFNDPNENHIGLDIDSLNSIKTADVFSIGIDLKSGNMITAWIDYKNVDKSLKVFLSYSSTKPLEPLLVVDVDLSEYLREFKYVGFSASTEGSTEFHLLENWRFSTFGVKSSRPRFPPYNVSDNSVIRSPPRKSISGSGSKYHKRLGWGFGIAGPAFFCVFIGLVGYITVKKWKEMRMDKSFQADLVTGPRQFSYKELKAATKGFHASRIVGHGAFGTVYKAFFTSLGTMSAVKRSKHSNDGKSEFLAELSIIACLRHKNLVQLQGWCAEKGELLLVYEFMPNGSVDDVLYQVSDQGLTLKWPHRYNIALGLASVLTYLHQECEQQVIHRDIKTSNIMLDANFNARLGDFGLARLMEHDKSPVSTLTAGTMGYLAPEYLQYGKATEKSDVFSYGVVILELACGRRPIDKEIEGQRMVNLVDWVWELHSEGRLAEAVDRRLNGVFNVEEAKMLLLVGLSCANPDSAERPSMRRVFQILKGEAEPVLVPKVKPTLSFSNHLLSVQDIVSGSEGQTPEHMFEINVV